MEQSREPKKFKILQVGDARFFIKSIKTKGKDGVSYADKNGNSYINILFRVTDSNNVSEDIYKIFSLKYDRDIIKLLKCIGRPELVDYIKVKGFEWDDLEDEGGLCRLELEHSDRWGDRTVICSFIKKSSSLLAAKNDTMNKAYDAYKATKPHQAEVENDASHDTSNDMPIVDDLPF